MTRNASRLSPAYYCCCQCLISLKTQKVVSAADARFLWVLEACFCSTKHGPIRKGRMVMADEPAGRAGDGRRVEAASACGARVSTGPTNHGVHSGACMGMAARRHLHLHADWRRSPGPQPCPLRPSPSCQFCRVKRFVSVKLCD